MVQRLKHYRKLAKQHEDSLSNSYSPTERKGYTTITEGAAGGIRLYSDDECMNTDNVTWPRHVDYVKIMSYNQIQIRSNPNNLSYMQVEVHKQNIP